MITKKIYEIYLSLGILVFLSHLLHAHDNLTIHPMLMEKAYDAWSKKSNQLFFSNLGIDQGAKYSYMGLPADAASLTLNITTGEKEWTLIQPSSLKDWLIAGVVDEDAPEGRCLAHFYNPYKPYHYLTDPIAVSGRDSFEWASTGESFSPHWSLNKSSPGANEESWGKARQYYLQALTNSSKAGRDENMAHTFYALGKVSHLLQDLSQPEHVRNDAHLINGSGTIGWLPDVVNDTFFHRARWIENYGAENVKKISSFTEFKNVSALDWRAVGFTKMEDFWDRRMYRGDSADLDADITDSKKLLGLSEFINGNFLGADASYGDFFEVTDNHYFPHPVLNDTNASNIFQRGIWAATTWEDSAAVDPVNGRFRKSIFLEKSRSGVFVKNHSALNFSLYYITSLAKNSEIKTCAGVSINAPTVLRNYHQIALPKAVQYTAGLIDYFFRGNINISVVWDETSGREQLAISNNSGMPIKGGEFKLFADSQNASETRSEVASFVVDNGTWNESRTLENGETVNATFLPLSEDSNCMLVYKGVIGLDSSGNEADPTESGKAIAASHFAYEAPPYPEPILECVSVFSSNDPCGEINDQDGVPYSTIKTTHTDGHTSTKTYSHNPLTGECMSNTVCGEETVIVSSESLIEAPVNEAPYNHTSPGYALPTGYPGYGRWVYRVTIDSSTVYSGASYSHVSTRTYAPDGSFTEGCSGSYGLTIKSNYSETYHADSPHNTPPDNWVESYQDIYSGEWTWIPAVDEVIASAGVEAVDAAPGYCKFTGTVTSSGYEWEEANGTFELSGPLLAGMTLETTYPTPIEESSVYSAPTDLSVDFPDYPEWTTGPAWLPLVLNEGQSTSGEAYRKWSLATTNPLAPEGVIRSEKKFEYRIRHLNPSTNYLKVWLRKTTVVTASPGTSPPVSGSTSIDDSKTYEWAGTIDAGSQIIVSEPTEVPVPTTNSTETISILKYSCVEGYIPDLSDPLKPNGFPIIPPAP